jgi:hypothetical protein
MTFGPASALLEQELAQEMALLEARGPTLVIEALSRPDSTVARQAKSEGEIEALRGYLHKLTGMDDEFCAFSSKEGKAGAEGVITALWGWLLCLEYVHEEPILLPKPLPFRSGRRTYAGQGSRGLCPPQLGKP